MKLGYLADHLLLKITASVNNNEKLFRFFVKKFPQHTYPIMKKYIRQSNVFSKEIFLYKVLIARFKTIAEVNFVAQCYYAEDELIIFEDLTQQQYKLCELEEFDETHLKLTLETIASLHAVSIAYEKHFRGFVDEFPNELNDGINRKEENFTGYAYLQAAHKGLLHAVNLLGLKKIDKIVFKNCLNEMFSEIFTLLSQNQKYKNVLNHGDLWSKNLLFKYENDIPKQCKLVDFQLIRYTPPANDVLYFLLHALKHKTSNKVFEKYLQFYYATFSQQCTRKFGLDLTRILSFKEFELSCNVLLPALKLKHAYQIMLQRANVAYMSGVYKNSEIYTEYLFVNRSRMIEDMIVVDFDYKQIVEELLEDLEEVVEIKNCKQSEFFRLI